jgi:hypothetical protein
MSSRVCRWLKEQEQERLKRLLAENSYKKEIRIKKERADKEKNDKRKYIYLERIDNQYILDILSIENNIKSFDNAI